MGPLQEISKLLGIGSLLIIMLTIIVFFAAENFPVWIFYPVILIASLLIIAILLFETYQFTQV